MLDGSGRFDPEHQEYAAMIEAIEKAHGIKGELFERASEPLRAGMLAHYIAHARALAAEGMVALIQTAPSDTVAMLTAQKKVAAYAEVMGWIRDTLEAGEAAVLDWEDKRAFEDQQETE